MHPEEGILITAGCYQIGETLSCTLEKNGISIEHEFLPQEGFESTDIQEVLLGTSDIFY